MGVGESVGLGRFCAHLVAVCMHGEGGKKVLPSSSSSPFSAIVPTNTATWATTYDRALGE